MSDPKSQLEVAPTTETKSDPQLPPNTTEYGYKREWKTDGDINYAMTVFNRNPGDDTSETAKKLRSVVQNAGFEIDNLWEWEQDINNQHQAHVLVGIIGESITTQQAVQLHAKVEKALVPNGVTNLGLVIAWWNKGDKNTYTIQLHDYYGNNQLEVKNFYTGEGINLQKLVPKVK
ncbi:hypothetical protein EFBL_0389 [Effusibacillus lacus]|uniref:Uncharacterized protein n=1 Tax=Effusibacillus lacus TaxID=1348429 RepID=A0A292YJV5_9BACL|nr:hypothetical protein EFBL_0389 [Effusibacillus lacus]